MSCYFRATLLLLLTCCLQACGGSNSPDGDLPVAEPGIAVLMLGNSHTTPMPALLRTIHQSASTTDSAWFQKAAVSAYLIEHMNQSETLALLDDRRWTHWVLQALKYSTSGSVSYPVDGAAFFIEQARVVGTQPILFPEHPRAGNTWEADYLYQLHTSVAGQFPACVAPVGYVWEDFLAKSSLRLHAPDGNHASNIGAFLTALLLYTIISDQPVNSLPTINGVGINADDQALMRESVEAVLAMYPACAYYP